MGLLFLWLGLCRAGSSRGVSSLSLLPWLPHVTPSVLGEAGCRFSDPLRTLLQCESIAEEYEDELIEFFSHESDNVKDRLCSKRTGK